MLSKEARALIENIRAERWMFCGLNQNGHYVGCVKNYKGTKGNVAVVFALHEAYVICTGRTEYAVKTLSGQAVVQNVIQSKDFDALDVDCFEDVEVLVSSWGTSVVMADESVWGQLGLSVKVHAPDIERRLRMIAALDELATEEKEAAIARGECLF